MLLTRHDLTAHRKRLISRNPRSWWPGPLPGHVPLCDA